MFVAKLSSSFDASGRKTRDASSSWRSTRLLMCSVLSAQMAVGAASVDVRRSFADLTIEELMNESVTSVSKKETRLNESRSKLKSGAALLRR